MEACYSVELGAEDAVLDLPWSDPDGNVAYYDIRSDPELLEDIPEAQQYPDLRGFLRRINVRESPFETAKCDVWSTDDLQYEDVIFDASTKFGGYIDLVFTDDRRYSFAAHETFAREFAKRVRLADDIPASAELIVRRLHEQHGRPDAFYFTLYAFGFANQEAEARGHWAHALAIVLRALME
jgi:hypothetical protein